MYSGDDFYTCLTMEKRGENVMEFQLAADTSSSYNQSLCQSDKTFAQESWVTQGSKFFYISFYNCFSIAINISLISQGITVNSEEACPISGEYTGVIPDAVGLCAKMYSDCRNPQRMFYSVFSCHNHSEIYDGNHFQY